MIYAGIVLIVSFLILIHELGHFLTARAAGIPVEIFSVGFGPKIWSFRRGETEYRLSMIPFGGYVLPAVQVEEDFYRIPVYKRIIFSLGGPAGNLLFTFVLFAVLNIMTKGFTLWGVTAAPFIQTGDLMGKLAVSLAGIFSRPEQLSGVVGIVTQGSGFIGASYVKAVQFSLIISANLAFFNLLPVPALDGGKITLYILEMIHPKLKKAHLPMSLAGWVLIIGLVVYATVMDISRLI